jgi:hypothetical protein
MTIVKRPEEIPWKPLYNFSARHSGNRRPCSARSTGLDSTSS